MTESENCDSKYQKVANHLIITQRLKGKIVKKKKKKQTKKPAGKGLCYLQCFTETLMGTTKHRCSTDKKHKNRKLRKQTWQTETQEKRNNGDLKQPETQNRMAVLSLHSSIIT